MTNKINPIIALGIGKQPNEGNRGAAARSRVGTVGKSGELIPQDVINGFHIALDILMDFTCERFKVTRDEIVKEKNKVKRGSGSTEAKRFFYAAAFRSVRHLYPKLTTFARIGQELGADHCTALYHNKTHNGFMDTDAAYKTEFLDAVTVLEDRLDESSVPSLLSLRDRTVDDINALVNRLKTVDKRLKMQNINPLFIQNQIKL